MDTDSRRRLLETGEWRKHIIDEARTWKGTPFQHKARVKGVGCDCGGIIYQVYTPLLGPFAPFPKDYAQDWAMHNEDTRYLDFIMPHVVQIPKAIPGGLVLFKVGRSFSHAAICTEKGTFIHAWGRTQHGSVMESRIGFFRMGTVPRETKYFDVSI